jgi:phosphoglycolate phosphatase
LGLAGYFQAMLGGNFARRKPDGEHIHETLRLMGAQGRPAVMVGDSPTDVCAARAAGIPVIVLSSGYSRIPVAQLGGDRVLDSFYELPMALAELGQ